MSDPMKYEEVESFGYVSAAIDDKKLQIHFDAAPTMFWISQMVHVDGPVSRYDFGEPIIAIPTSRIGEVIEILESMRDWDWTDGSEDDEG